jgi:hypothetical protein
LSVPVATLLQRFKDGDRTAGPMLCRAYLPAVRAIALAGTLDPLAARTVTERSLLALRDGLPEVQEAPRLLPLAEEVTRTEVRKMTRESGGRSAHLLGLSAEAASRPRGPLVHLPDILGDQPPERAAWMLLEAATWLPPHSQVIFLLSYLEGLDYGEIANLSGTSAREVGNAITAARRLYEREFNLHLKKLAEP